jgi:hypothetical protein
MYSVVFWNTSDLPVMVDTWIEESIRLECVKIFPYEKCTLHSLTGEWYLNTIFHTNEDKQLWREKGLGGHTTLGKFRFLPCAQGERAWMEDPIFQCDYTIEEKLFSFSINIEGRL